MIGAGTAQSAPLSTASAAVGSGHPVSTADRLPRQSDGSRTWGCVMARPHFTHCWVYVRWSYVTRREHAEWKHSKDEDHSP